MAARLTLAGIFQAGVEWAAEAAMREKLPGWMALLLFVVFLPIAIGLGFICMGIAFRLCNEFSPPQ